VHYLFSYKTAIAAQIARSLSLPCRVKAKNQDR